MLKLIIGNMAYSSWSMRGWLACKHSGLPFEAQVVPMFTPEWEAMRATPAMSASRGMVPILWDGELCIWDSLAIIGHLTEKGDYSLFWPQEAAARALCRSMCAEMHSSFQALRAACPTNYRQTYPAAPVADDVAADVARISSLWTEARTKFGADGDFLFGQFGAGDIMFAPVVARFITYALPQTPVIATYLKAVRAHADVEMWYAEAAAEKWVIDKYER